jgi:2-keto-3-deoxy-L-rhamnonate aldolase RhmA
MGTSIVAPELSGLRAALHARRRLLCTFVLVPRLEMIELAAIAGFDGAVIDLEHGPIASAELPALAAAARGAGIAAIARMSEGAPAEIGRTLDTGVTGVLVPHVSSRAQAQEIVAAARYLDGGERSINPYVRGSGYAGTEPGRLAEVDAATAVIAMLEGAAALESLEGICTTEGLDAAFVGPVDLSSSLGLPGEPEHPQVVAEVGRVLDRIEACGIAAGVYAPTPTAAARWFAAGATLVALSADTALALEGMRAARAATRAEAPR